VSTRRGGAAIVGGPARLCLLEEAVRRGAEEKYKCSRRIIRGRTAARVRYCPNLFESASSNNCCMSSGVDDCLRNRQNVSSRNCREMFSNALR